MSLRQAVASSNGNFNAQPAGTVIAGSSIFLGQSWRKVSGLSSLVTLTAATATLTMATKWQASNDGVTWYDIANGSQNAAAVAVTTGTSAAVVKVIPAPDSVYGYAFARLAVVSGVATGAAGDLYVVSYNYRQLTGAEGASA